MKKLFAVSTIVLFMFVLFAAPVMADSGNHYGWGKKHHSNNHNTNINTNRNNNTNTNRNNNTNTNRNNNTNLQGQAQGQLQGQAQGQLQGQAQKIEEGAVSIDNRSYGAEQKDVTTSNLNMRGNRDFANPGQVSFAPLPSFFGSAENNGNIRSVKTIIMYKNVFTRADVKGLLKGVSADSDRTVPEVADKRDTDTVTVVLVPVAKDLVEKQCAVITSKATSDEASSVNALAGAIMEALDSGADLLVITGEGAGSELKSFGWGIGLAYSHATIATDERSSGIGSGGMGISGGSAGYGYFPWVQGIALELK